MPIYDYKCLACNKKFSLVLTVEQHEKKRVKCPSCHSSKVEQQIAAFFAVTSKKS
jgi:putative FmdB family regulatory protein